MIVWRYLLYVLACQFYCLRLAAYGIHSLLVFAAKPGARLVVPIVLLGVIYFARGPIDALAGPTINAFWQGALGPLLGPDLFQLLAPFKIEASALIVLLLFAIAFALISSMLRPIVGTFSAPRKPLPPQPPMIAPDTEVKRVKAVLAIPKRARNRFDGDLGALLARVPDHVRHVTRSD
jgi:hypothetical protein